jgi:hypothetical protein
MRKKTTSVKKQTIYSKVGRHFLTCSECSVYELESPLDVAKVICARCVQKMAAPPEGVKEKSDKPKGWHLKRYFEYNGSVYSKGKLVEDKVEIKKLKKLYGSTV